MFIFNLKMNKKALCRAFIAISLLIIIIIILYIIFIMFFNKKSTCDSGKNDLIELNEANYTNFLKAANEDVNSYIGSKVKIVGYVYRLIDFEKNQFVVARDMKVGKTSQSLIVGFLCESNEASKYSDGTWIEIIGRIKKGRFNDELAILDVISIRETNKPENIFVNPPDKTYIPTSSLFK